MEKQTIYIKSYYSEGCCTEGLYKITYPANMDLEIEIERKYDDLQSEGESNYELSCMLDALVKEGKDIQYEVLEVTDFDCDHGIFD